MKKQLLLLPALGMSFMSMWGMQHHAHLRDQFETADQVVGKITAQAQATGNFVYTPGQVPPTESSADTKCVVESLEQKKRDDMSQRGADIRENLPPEIQSLIDSHYSLVEDRERLLSDFTVSVPVGERCLNVILSSFLYHIALIYRIDRGGYFLENSVTLFAFDDGKFVMRKEFKGAYGFRFSVDGQRCHFEKSQSDDSYPAVYSLQDLESTSMSCRRVGLEYFGDDQEYYGADGTYYLSYYQRDKFIYRYSLPDRTKTTRHEFSEDFLKNHDVIGILDDRCIVVTIDLENDNKPIDVSFVEYGTEKIISSIDLKKWGIDLGLVHINLDNSLIFLEDVNKKKNYIFDVKTSKLLQEIPQLMNHEVCERAQFSHDNEWFIEHYYDPERSYKSNYVLRFKRIKSRKHNFVVNMPIEVRGERVIKKVNMLPFIDWLYTTQKERKFAPLTLTQDGWNLFTQLDHMSKLALMQNLNLRAPKKAE